MTPGLKPATILIPKILAGCFILFMLLIVTLANRGEGDRWWSFIDSIPYGDKLGHVGLMGTLCLLCNLAFTPRRYRFLPPFITRVTFILFVIITLEELSQAFISTRSCDPFDWLADLAGLTLGQLAATAIRKIHHTPISFNHSP
jgi:prepilin signal peptidase PulO-like enzyme (type II secretory pathway)